MTNYARSVVYSTDDLEAIARVAGSHFFSPSTMRFFNSRILRDVYPHEDNPGNRYVAQPGARFIFVTSERYGDAPRHYNVRLATLTTKDTGQGYVFFDTLDRYATPAQARRAAKEAASAPLTAYTPV